MSILTGVTYDMLKDENLKQRVIEELNKLGYDLVMPPDVPVPFKDEFMNSGSTWTLVNTTTYANVAFTEGCRAYVVRRRSEGLRLMSFFFQKKKEFEVSSGYIVEFLSQSSFKRLDNGEPVIIPKGTTSADYRVEASTHPIPENHVRVLIHGNDIGLTDHEYFEIDVPLSIIAFFSYEHDPRTGKIAFKVYKSGYKEKV